jgi:hypothetical protein
MYDKQISWWDFIKARFTLIHENVISKWQTVKRTLYENEISGNAEQFFPQCGH